MKVAAILMSKDESDVAYHTVMHLAEEGIDTIIVADNMSTDNTVEELEKAKKELKGKCEVVILEDNIVAYYQSEKMTNLAKLAHEIYGATWIIPCDFDELWYCHEDNIKNYLNSLPKNVNVVNADLYNHFGSALDCNCINPFTRIKYRQAEKGALPKVAFKWSSDAVIMQGNHNVKINNKVVANGLEIRHFPYRSWEHFKRKALNGLKAYEETDLPYHIGEHWRNYGRLIQQFGDEKIRKEVFETYFWFLSPTDHGLIKDPAPFRRWNS